MKRKKISILGRITVDRKIVEHFHAGQSASQISNKLAKFAPLVTLGNTLENWQKEIVRMWRFSKTNSITEGLHRRMDEILNRAYGMRNFNNFRIRVKAYAG